MPQGANYTCSRCGAGTTVYGPGFLEYKTDSGDITPLGHPGESRRLEARGTTLREAKQALRLYATSDWGCRACGRIFAHRHLLTPQGVIGGNVWMALLLLGLISTLFVLPAHFWPAMPLRVAALVAVLCGVRWIDGRLARARYGRYAEPMRPQNCPACRSTDVKHALLFNTTEPALACPTCGERSLADRQTWIS